MEISNTAFYLGLWGASLSTLMAVLKIFELWKSRIKVDVTYQFTSSEEIGSKIIISNLTPRPIGITYWKLVWVKWKFPSWQKKEEISPDPLDDTHFTIGAYQQHVLNFDEGENLPWGRDAIPLGVLRLDLSVAGRAKPVRISFYDPSK